MYITKLTITNYRGIKEPRTILLLRKYNYKTTLTTHYGKIQRTPTTS